MGFAIILLFAIGTLAQDSNMPTAVPSDAATPTNADSQMQELKDQIAKGKTSTPTPSMASAATPTPTPTATPTTAQQGEKGQEVPPTSNNETSTDTGILDSNRTNSNISITTSKPNSNLATTGGTSWNAIGNIICITTLLIFLC